MGWTYSLKTGADAFGFLHLTDQLLPFAGPGDGFGVTHKVHSTLRPEECIENWTIIPFKINVTIEKQKKLRYDWVSIL